MVESLIPQLDSTEAREAVAQAVIALFARWQLHEVNQAQLLGLSSGFNLKSKITEGDTNTMERVGCLLAIDRALKKHFPSQPATRDRWIFTGNSQLNGVTPLSVMLDKGLPGIVLVKELAQLGE